MTTTTLHRAAPRSGNSAFDRFAFTSGILAATLTLAGAALFIVFIVPDMPAIFAPAAERAAFAKEMSRNSVYRTISYLGQMQMALLLLFAGGLHGVLRSAEGGSGALSNAVLAAAIALAVITPGMIMIEDHLMFAFAGAGAEAAVVASVDGLGPLSFALSGFPQAIVLGGSSLLLSQNRMIPRSIGWFGFAVAALSIVGTGTLVKGAMFPISSLAMLLSRIWLLALCIVLLRRARM